MKFFLLIQCWFKSLWNEEREKKTKHIRSFRPRTQSVRIEKTHPSDALPCERFHFDQYVIKAIIMCQHVCIQFRPTLGHYRQQLGEVLHGCCWAMVPLLDTKKTGRRWTK